MPQLISRVVMALAVIISTSCVCHGQFKNSSFETGDFTGWVLHDVSSPYRALTVAGSGITDNAFSSFATAPTDGNFAAIHGFDGSAGTIRIAQDVFITGDELTFDYRSGWDMVPYGATQPRIFTVNVESLGGSSNPTSHTVLTATNGTNVNDTGDHTETVDVSAFIGQTVRVSFDWTIPESFTGPGLFQLDNVQMNLIVDPLYGQLQGTAAQTSFQTQSFLLTSLSRRVNAFASGYEDLARSSIADSDFNDVQLVSYDDSPVNVRRHAQSHARRPRNQWNGWVTGYGIGGNVQGKDRVAGLDYQNGGTQFGVFRVVDQQTLLGAFGGYGHQSIETLAAQSSDADSGQVGGFLHRHDICGNYYFLAGDVGFDAYETNRQTMAGVASGDYDGMQSGLYLERGWNRKSFWGSWNPNVALQHVWVEQDAHTEMGPLGTSIDQVDAHSLRHIVGGRFFGTPREYHYGQLNTVSHIQWMHEYLDTATPVTANVLGNNISTYGLDLGRNWAMLGTGLIYHRGKVDWYGNYDLQFNDRQTFHVGSGGLLVAW